MRKNIFEITYFETYYFANIISNILNDPSSYLRTLEDFFGNDNYLSFINPFPKFSRLHSFIVFVLDVIHTEDLGNTDINNLKNQKIRLWVELAFENFNVDYETFNSWLLDKEIKRDNINEDIVDEYFEELILTGYYYDLLEKISEEIFFIIFLNRQLLQNFNILISHRILNVSFEEIDDDLSKFFSKSGVLKRVHIPRWVQKAVYFRDRGMCVSCHKDLTGTVNIANTHNFDHIIPLKNGGINDISNVQLLCEKCNKSKGSNLLPTSKKYESWY